MSDIEQEESDPHYTIKFKSDQSIDTYLRRDGECEVTFANGDRFEGAYLDGKRHGPGTYTYASGAVFTGLYEAGLKTGPGTFRYPDQSIYTGEFANDKRHGHGVYRFKNGDYYEGSWKKGLKHGKGVYVFSDNQSINQSKDQLVEESKTQVTDESINQKINQLTRVEGDWSNGSLLHGAWSQSFNDRLIARFLSNQPNGHSIYQSSKGFLYAGNQSVDSDKNVVFQPLDLVKPVKSGAQSINQSIVPPDALTLAIRSLSVAVLNSDWIEGNYRLKKLIEGAPNFRRINQSINQSDSTHANNDDTTEDQSINQSNIFVSGQPSLEGFKSLIEHLNESGYEKIVTIMCRREAVLYIGPTSFSPRHPKNVHCPLRFNLTINQLESLEASLVQQISEKLAHSGGLLTYQREVYAELEGNRRGISIEIDIEKNMKIQSINEIINQLIEQDGLNVSHVRNPMDERHVSLEEWSGTLDCVRSINQSMPDAGVVFIDWLGRENATAAAVLALANKQLGNSGFLRPDMTDSEEKEDDPTETETETGAGTGTEKVADEVEEEAEEEEEGEDQDEENAEKVKVEEKPLIEPQSINQSILEPEMSVGPPPEPELEPVVIDEKRGVFSVTHWLIHCLHDGEKAKDLTDRLIDDAAAAVNLRECIFQAHQEWRQANQTSSTQSNLWLAEARVAIERYCMMIASVAYLAAVRPPVEQNEDQEEEETTKTKTLHLTFEQWLPKQLNVDSLKDKCQLFAWD